jgi:hypothetical protein
VFDKIGTPHPKRQKMMHKILFAFTLSLALASCATTGNNSQPSISTSTVQQDAAAICQWVPVASDIAAVVAAMFNAGQAVITASTVAEQICSAVKAAEAAPAASGKYRATLPTAVDVLGVTVRRKS